MTETEFADLIGEAMYEDTQLSDAVDRVSTFEEAGLLTMNAGLVFNLDDGSEFQVTIVRSR